MSNQVVGNVYEQIIQKVIQSSQNDFEEFGVDVTTLEEMKQGWQDKLTNLKIASFPWDPQPEPPRQPPTVPSNVKQDADHSPAVDHANFPNVAVKTERGYEPPVSAYPQQPQNGYQGGFNGDVAAQRAQQLIAQRLGQVPQNMQMPMHPQQQQQPQQQPRVMPGQNTAQQIPPQQQRQPGQAYPPQTDGADDGIADWKAFLAAREAAGEEGRIAADQLMRTRVEAMMADQDNGLGMPLREMPKGKKRKAINRVRQSQQIEASSSSSATVPRVAPFDGEDDVKSEEENPEDAINSDLDDPEDDLDGADGSDDEMVDYMLCTYDKVQRVKNKWKCILKDGILTTNKKEFLFHKANGEFEW
ncbi:transcription factor IIA, alpha/beta subunit [Aaosphaeria arxii CBS 175.79]|uniref:Transcription factor IIA, alpha/beta subunit n=1 Tax=Aaosphaeria arxii CBS 175.79 TaxID=1450172 RepID=A0A6A5XXD1_9PLEO|nr:transcription factor IIA, alpha/beta subunit [Aaosphaeria arxii CBS 175.79]KAF2017629.1 transcription factor IIA, alpha/beta subunit [Aaosphaeria arxii CBS 175.79]